MAVQIVIAAVMYAQDTLYETYIIIFSPIMLLCRHQHCHLIVPYIIHSASTKF